MNDEINVLLIWSFSVHDNITEQYYMANYDEV